MYTRKMPIMATPRPCTPIKWINLKCIISIMRDMTIQSRVGWGEGGDKMTIREGEKNGIKGGEPGT